MLVVRLEYSRVRFKHKSESESRLVWRRMEGVVWEGGGEGASGEPEGRGAGGR